MKHMRLTTHNRSLRVLQRAGVSPGLRGGAGQAAAGGRPGYARQRQGLTQAALAKRLKVSQPFIAKLEQAKTHNFTLDTLLRIVEALNGELVIKIRQRAPHHAHA